jgi:UDP-GlcNAc3NAcA epimerase
MYDNTLYFKTIAPKFSTVVKDLELDCKPYILGTIHRDNNTDEPARMNEIFRGILDITEQHNIQIVLPLHPRTSKVLDKNLDKGLLQRISNNTLIRITEPVSFFDMVILEENASLIMTDSGGVQKEAYFNEKPCIILRPETEWVEIVEQRTAIITDANAANISKAYNDLISRTDLSYPPIFGDGHAAEFICQQLITYNL